MKYKVKHTEMWSWYEIIEAEDEEDLESVLDDYEWSLPDDANFDEENELEEVLQQIVPALNARLKYLMEIV